MGGDAPPSVVVVDDASEVRLLVRTRLRLSGAVEVVGEAANGVEAVEAAREKRPDLVLLDVSMPVMDGLEALPRVLEASPGTRVVLYSGFEEQGLADRALELGAADFVEKSAPIDELIERLLAVAAGGVGGGAPGRGDLPDDIPRYVTRRPESVDQHVLDEHLERFREVFESAAIGMATMTLSGSIVRANPAMGELLERPAQDLVGTFYGDLTVDGAADVHRLLEEIRERPLEVVKLEHEVPGTDGRLLVLSTFAPVRDSAGRPLYVFVQVQDVTAERKALEDLRRSEERFRLLVEVVEDYAIFMLDPDGHIASWNAGAQRSQGYTADEIIGQHFRVFYPPEVAAAKHPEHELEVAVREGHYAEEGWRIRKDGTRFWAYVVITAVFDAEGHHLGFTKVTRDVTERRRTEETLRASEQRFRLLVEAVEDYAIFMLDPGGHIASWNAGAQRSMGYKADEIIGRHFRTFYPPDVAAARHPEHELEEALQHGHYEEEGWRIRKDGTRFWSNVVITAVFDSSGEHVGFTKVTRDTSERRKLEQERESALRALESANGELETLNARLREAADEQAQFLAVTAHELRTPVGLLSGSAEMLARHWGQLTEEERRETFDAMASSSTRLRRLVDDLLTASRLQNSALSMRYDRLAVSQIIDAAVDTVHRTQPSGVIEVGAMPDAYVLGDRDRLAQAVENLVLNALRHGRPPVEVSAAVEGDMVRIRVCDSGPGVSDEISGRLFERFATGVTKGGTGLGLFIVRELARAHGGDALYVPGTDGRGHAFVIALPVTPDPDPASSAGPTQ